MFEFRITFMILFFNVGGQRTIQCDINIERKYVVSLSPRNTENKKTKTKEDRKENVHRL